MSNNVDLKATCMPAIGFLFRPVAKVVAMEDFVQAFDAYWAYDGSDPEVIEHLLNAMFEARKGFAIS